MTLQLRIAYTMWAIFLVSWYAAGVLSGRTATAIPKARERPYTLFVALGWASIVIPPGTPMTPVVWRNPAPLGWVWLSLVAAGFASCWWGRLHLGRLWSASVTRKERHRVVDTGPYRLVRHPIYTGFILSYFGVAMISATTLALLAVAFFTIGLWLKARLEEEFLSEELGSGAYAAYKARTPMLLPRPRRRETLS